jgi:hypothetical protein
MSILLGGKAHGSKTGARHSTSMVYGDRDLFFWLSLTCATAAFSRGYDVPAVLRGFFGHDVHDLLVLVVQPMQP